MTTGRQLAERALRPPMQEIGWRPRAAGWFTREVAPGYLGVIAVSAASSGHAKETADISLHVGLRDESVEPIVSRLCAIEDRGYQTRTVITPIGYLMPEPRWRDWLIDADTADEVCSELTQNVGAFAGPYLDTLGTDRRALLDQARANRVSWPGACRVAVLTHRLDGPAAAEAFLAGLDLSMPIELQMLDRLRDRISHTD